MPTALPDIALQDVKSEVASLHSLVDDNATFPVLSFALQMVEAGQSKLAQALVSFPNGRAIVATAKLNLDKLDLIGKKARKINGSGQEFIDTVEDEAGVEWGKAATTLDDFVIKLSVEDMAALPDLIPMATCSLASARRLALGSQVGKTS